MRTRRTPRLGPDDVDRLVAGDPAGPDHRALAALLDAARSSPTPEELAGERAAVARFVAAYRDGPTTSLPKGRNRVRRPSPARVAMMKVAASVAVLAVGGTAVAAEAGRLPAAAQRQAHDLFGRLGVPAPDTSDRPAASPAPSAAGAPAPAATASGAAPDSGEIRARRLCQAWRAQRQPHNRAMTAEARRELAALAGGTGRIAAFCASRADTGTPLPSDSPSSRGKGSPAPGSTGNGNGPGQNNGNGPGTNNGNGNGPANGDEPGTGNDHGNGNKQGNGDAPDNEGGAGPGPTPTHTPRR
ncbi:MAG TPA: hypothetical protein VFH03_13805 [Actinoplanes sp.]|nr:hypothetical protein [Actinoplanes sp.]